MPNKALAGWVQTTLWFKRGIDDQTPLEFVVLSPPACPNRDSRKLFERTASQIVGIIQELTGARMVIQGQYSRITVTPVLTLRPLTSNQKRGKPNNSRKETTNGREKRKPNAPISSGEGL